MDSLKEQLQCKILGKIELPKTKPENKAVIVTSNKAFSTFIKKYAPSWGFNEVDENTPTVAKATKALVKGKIVFGKLPNHLGCQAVSVVELEIILPPALRNRSRNTLSLQELEKYVDERHVHEYVISVLVDGSGGL